MTFRTWKGKFWVFCRIFCRIFVAFASTIHGTMEKSICYALNLSWINNNGWDNLRSFWKVLDRPEILGCHFHTHLAQSCIISVRTFCSCNMGVRAFAIIMRFAFSERSQIAHLASHFVPI